MPENRPSDNRRRIFCVITQGELGGAQQFLIQLASRIDSKRFHLRIVTGRCSANKPTIAALLPSWIDTATASHLVRQISPLHDIRAIAELREMMRRYKPDIVLCISSKAGFVGSLAAHGLRKRLPQLRVIYRIGGWTFNDPWPQWKKRLYIWLERLSARWKDVIVVNNARDLEQMRTLGIMPRKSVACIYNGIDPYMEPLSHIDARAALNRRIPEHRRISRHEHLVGTVANFYPTKGLEYLVNAASLTDKSVRFVVIGDGPERAKLERQIVALGLQGRFFLLGQIPNAYRYVSAFDIFVLPSVKEGFPWAVLEAMAAKVPIIATDVGAIPEIIEDHTSGVVVEPGNIHQLAGAIANLLGNYVTRQNLAIHAHQRLIGHFSLRSMIDQYERLFTSS